MACKCGVCTPTNEKVSIFLTRELRACEKIIKNSSHNDPQPLFLGLFTMSGWNHHVGLFVFKCRNYLCRTPQRGFICHNPHNDHPVLHFHCAYCDFEENFAVYPQTYDEVGLERPLGGLSPFIEKLKDPICPRVSGSRS